MLSCLKHRSSGAGLFTAALLLVVTAVACGDDVDDEVPVPEGSTPAVPPPTATRNITAEEAIEIVRAIWSSDDAVELDDSGTARLMTMAEAWITMDEESGFPYPHAPATPDDQVWLVRVTGILPGVQNCRSDCEYKPGTVLQTVRLDGGPDRTVLFH